MRQKIFSKVRTVKFMDDQINRIEAILSKDGPKKYESFSHFVRFAVEKLLMIEEKKGDNNE